MNKPFNKDILINGLISNSTIPKSKESEKKIGELINRVFEELKLEEFPVSHLYVNVCSKCHKIVKADEMRANKKCGDCAKAYMREYHAKNKVSVRRKVGRPRKVETSESSNTSSSSSSSESESE